MSLVEGIDDLMEAEGHVSHGRRVRERIEQWLDDQGDPITVYRSVVLKDSKTLNLRNLGRFWTPEKKIAKAMAVLNQDAYGETLQGTGFVVAASVTRKDNVDKNGTISAMQRHPAEREIRLIAGSSVKVLYVEGPNGRESINRLGKV